MMAAEGEREHTGTDSAKKNITTPPTPTTTPPRMPSQSSVSGHTGQKQRRDGEGEEEEPQLKRRRVVLGETRNYHPRANRFTTQSQATAMFMVTEAARTKKPMEENNTTSRIVPTINIHDDPPECLNEGEGKVMETIKASLDRNVSSELLIDHFIGRCVRKGKETTPTVSTEEYVTSLCQRVEDMKDERRKEVASRYIGAKF